jgi:sulfonate transport system substrate-binding protein
MTAGLTAPARIPYLLVPAAGMSRRTFLRGVAAGAAVIGLGACAEDGQATTAAAATEPLPTTVPAGTELSIASATGAQQLQLELAGLTTDLPFTVSSWPNIGAGPDVINAFRADALEVGNNAGIPPIQAHYQGLDARIVAVCLTRKPTYVFATKPGSEIETVDDFAGRKLAFSQGQAQGVVLLRALAEAGIAQDDVDLVPLTSNQFLTALQAGQVDIAPLYLAQVPPYLDQYGPDGAHQIETDVVDLLNVLWAPTDVLADEGKAAAVAAYVPVWAQGLVWVWENPETWIDEYYVATQNIDAEAAAEIVALSNKPLLPPSWDEAVAWEQETIDLLAEGGYVDSFDAEDLFDRRFEPLAAEAVAAEYRS